MASIECDKVGNYLVRFRWGGRPFKRSLDTQIRDIAEAGVARVDETIMRLKRGWLTIPDEAEPGLFIVSGGTLTAKPRVSEVCRDDLLSLGRLVDFYVNNPPESKEPGTIKVERSYLRNVVRITGECTPLDKIDLTSVRSYARKRLAEVRGGQRRAKPYTVRKELKTLRYIWEWAFRLGHVGKSPVWALKDVDLPKDEEKGHYLTSAQIKAQIDRGGFDDAEQRALWDRLFLTDADLRDLLDHVKRQATDPWVYPAVAFAGLTGARRSEIRRSEIDDFDLDGGRVVVREKKRDKHKSVTFRSVDLHPILANVMKDWFAEHPGGRYSLCRPDGSPIDVDVMDNRLESVLKGSRWATLKGWHVFRHSFCSILASNGVDQRVIDSFVGHETEEMRRRYRHLFPTTLRSAILSLLP